MTKKEKEAATATAANNTALHAAWKERVEMLVTLAKRPGVPNSQASEWLACAQEIARCYREQTGLPLEVQS
jgi:hypothetical protein